MSFSTAATHEGCHADGAGIKSGILSRSDPDHCFLDTALLTQIMLHQLIASSIDAADADHCFLDTASEQNGDQEPFKSLVLAALLTQIIAFSIQRRNRSRETRSHQEFLLITVLLTQIIASSIQRQNRSRENRSHQELLLTTIP
jgi:preprotein translocase subunit YajC